MTIAEKHMTPAVEEFMRGLFNGHIAGEVEAVAVAKVFSETCQHAIDEALEEAVNTRETRPTPDQLRIQQLEAAIVQYAIESGWHRMDGEAYPVIAELINRPKEKP